MRNLERDIELTGKKLAFVFLEENIDGCFSNKTRSGIVYRESKEKQIGKPRWGQIIMAGPDSKEVERGDFVLVDALRWTTGLIVGESEDRFWITDESDIIAISDEPPQSL